VPGASEDEVIARVDAVLDRYGSVGAYGREDQVFARFLDDEIRGQRASGFIAPAVFLDAAETVSGRLECLDLDEGASVDRGDVLARIYPTPIDTRRQEEAAAAVGAASAALREADATCRCSASRSSG
jgi:hypothetical protein